MLNKDTVEAFLEDWLRKAEASAIRMLRDVAKTLRLLK
jgi:hypothetical protein